MTRFDKIKARLASATPGPWQAIWKTGESGRYSLCMPGRGALTELSMCLSADADFVAHSREDVEWLVEAVESLLVLYGQTNEMACHPDVQEEHDEIKRRLRENGFPIDA